MKKYALFLIVSAILFASRSYSQTVPFYVPTSGLVAWYPFTGNANDSSGHAINGTVNGASLDVDRFGNANAAYSYDGSTGYIEIPYDSLFDNAIYSFSFWVKTSVSTSALGGPGVNPGIISRAATGGSGLTTGSSDPWAIYECGGTGAYNAAGCAGGIATGGASVGTAHTISDNIWHHIVYTVSIDSAISYMDNIRQGATRYTTPITYSPYVTRIGLSLNTYWGAFQGDIDDFAIYNRVLTPGEVTQLYNALYTPLRADSFAVYVTNDSSGLRFTILTNLYSTGQHVKTYFGNGNTLDTITSIYGSNGIAHFSEVYASSGIYTIKHVLFDGATPVDSITYYDTVTLWQNLALGFYNDVLGTCLYNDSADALIPLPILVAVDSNSVPVDTISATSGMYYTAYGNPGDIYTFSVISNPGGVTVTCPSSGSISDTLFSGVNPVKYFGVSCITTTSFDLDETMGTRTGRHMQTLDINVGNAYCTDEPAVLTMVFSPQYVFGSASPAPSSVSGNIAIWNLGSISILNSPADIYVTLHVPGTTWLTPGDTVMTNCVVTPIIGDSDTVSNVIIRTDTVTSSYDPNEMAVSPKGCIPSGTVTQLQYTILFENTGNDTAHNIYVMDTLSDNLDPHSLRIVSASNKMNVSKWYNSTAHNIYKFEFPHINLLDSSHHNKCDGMLIYTINTKAGLASGATIFNHAGIFFDDNPVVMTDTTENVVGCLLGLSTPHPTLPPSIFPNPATNELTIKTGSENYTSFAISNMFGQPILQQSISTTETKVNVVQLPVGVYYVIFKGENGDAIRKFVKM